MLQCVGSSQEEKTMDKTRPTVSKFTSEFDIRQSENMSNLKMFFQSESSSLCLSWKVLWFLSSRMTHKTA